MYTAAEALMRSDCGKVKHTNDTNRTYFFDDENKVWKEEWKMAVGADYSSNSSKYFFLNNFLPVMAEKTELEKAGEKYFGKWVKVKLINMAFQVLDLQYEGKNKNYSSIVLRDHQGTFFYLGEVELLEIEK